MCTWRFFFFLYCRPLCLKPFSLSNFTIHPHDWGCDKNIIEKGMVFVYRSPHASRRILVQCEQTSMWPLSAIIGATACEEWGVTFRESFQRERDARERFSRAVKIVGRYLSVERDKSRWRCERERKKKSYSGIRNFRNGIKKKKWKVKPLLMMVGGSRQQRKKENRDWKWNQEMLWSTRKQRRRTGCVSRGRRRSCCWFIDGTPTLEQSLDLEFSVWMSYDAGWRARIKSCLIDRI